MPHYDPNIFNAVRGIVHSVDSILPSSFLAHSPFIETLRKIVERGEPITLTQFDRECKAATRGSAQ